MKWTKDTKKSRNYKRKNEKIKIFSLFLAVFLMIGAMPMLGAGEKAGGVDLAVNGTHTEALENLYPNMARFESEIDCKSAILMDASTGTVLYEKSADTPLPPASVTKIMTLLLVMEAIEAGQLKLTDMITVSANAASMGGSQVFLKEGETMSAEEMIKCVVIASANDCAVALAEHVAGSEEGFVARMNSRAAELGLKNTNFENTNGLDDTVENHVTSAYDIAVMSAALIRHPTILKYSGTWMDTIRDGTFGLTNTNRLVRFYRGCTGLKTGSTAKAGFCVSATAERDGLSLICVVMGAPGRDQRNAIATKLLDYGFANFSRYEAKGRSSEVKVLGGKSTSLTVSFPDFCTLIPKGIGGKITSIVDLPAELEAPLREGECVGKVTYYYEGNEIGQTDILATHSVDKLTFGTLFCRILAGFMLL